MRRSYERAIDESLFSQIKPMESFRTAAAARSFVTLPKTVYLEDIWDEHYKKVDTNK